MTQGKKKKFSTAGLYSEFFFFSEVGWIIKAKSPSLSYYLPITRIIEEMGSCLWKRKLEHKQLCPGFELGSLTLFPTMLTILNLDFRTNTRHETGGKREQIFVT